MENTLIVNLEHHIDSGSLGPVLRDLEHPVFEHRAEALFHHILRFGIGEVALEHLHRHLSLVIESGGKGIYHLGGQRGVGEDEVFHHRVAVGIVAVCTIGLAGDIHHAGSRPFDGCGTFVDVALLIVFHGL